MVSVLDYAGIGGRRSSLEVIILLCSWTLSQFLSLPRQSRDLNPWHALHSCNGIAFFTSKNDFYFVRAVKDELVPVERRGCQEARYAKISRFGKCWGDLQSST